MTISLVQCVMCLMLLSFHVKRFQVVVSGLLMMCKVLESELLQNPNKASLPVMAEQPRAVSSLSALSGLELLLAVLQQTSTDLRDPYQYSK